MGGGDRLHKRKITGKRKKNNKKTQNQTKPTQSHVIPRNSILPEKEDSKPDGEELFFPLKKVMGSF